MGLFDDLVESTLLAGGKSKKNAVPRLILAVNNKRAYFWKKKKEKKDGNLGDPARGQADPGSPSAIGGAISGEIGKTGGRGVTTRGAGHDCQQAPSAIYILYRSVDLSIIGLLV
jgi:hypothetical protein